MSLKRYEAILALVSFNREMTVDEIAGTLKVNRRTILRDIDYLRTHKKIKRVGGRKMGIGKALMGKRLATEASSKWSLKNVTKECH